MAVSLSSVSILSFLGEGVISLFLSSVVTILAGTFIYL
jgi:hypothetical protein